MAYVRLIKLTSTDGGEGNSNWQYIWNIPTYQNFGGSINTPVTPNPLPEEDETNNVLIKIEGNTATNTITYIQNNGTQEVITDGAGQTVTSVVSDKPTTIWPILNSVVNYFKPKSIDDSYLYQVMNGSVPAIGRVDLTTPLYSKRGTFNKLDWSMASPVTMRWSLDFIEGNVTASFDFQPPLTPTATIVGGNGTISLTVTKNSSDSGGNYDGLVTEYSLLTGPARTDLYRPTTEFSTTISRSLSSIASGTYSVRVALLRNGTTGAFSYPVLVTVT